MMSKLFSSKRLSIFALVLITALSALTGLRISRAAETNTIRIEAGETLEIGTDTASPKSEFSWILTKDRKFQSAQRTRFFQTRLAEPGTYVLDVSVQDPITSENGYRAFTIVVIEPTGNLVTRTSDTTKPLSAILTTDPGSQNGVAYVSPEGGMLKIDPSGSDGTISTYHIDLDSSVDSDADGNTTNDIDNLGTISEKSGTSLYVFMLPKASERKVKLTVTSLNSIEPMSSELGIIFAAAPAQTTSSTNISTNPNSPIQVEVKGTTVQFSTKPTDPSAAGRELLYEWDFGDKSKSLLNRPLHTYGAPGQYTVALKVRDIATAEVLYEGTDSIVINSESGSASSSSTEGTVSSSSSTPGTGAESQVSLKGILQVLFIIFLLLGFAIGLYVLFTWIKRKTSSSLQKTLEKMEGNLVKKEEAIDETKPSTMKLKKENPKTVEKSEASEVIIDREQAKPEFKIQNRTNETPTASSGPVPSWLAKAATIPTSAATNKPADVVQNKPTAPIPTPVTVKPQQNAPVPSWLKPAPSTVPAPSVFAPTRTVAPEKVPTTVAANIVTPAKPSPAPQIEQKKSEAPLPLPPIPKQTVSTQVAPPKAPTVPPVVQPKAPEAPKPVVESAQVQPVQVTPTSVEPTPPVAPEVPKVSLPISPAPTVTTSIAPTVTTTSNPVVNVQETEEVPKKIIESKPIPYVTSVPKLEVKVDDEEPIAIIQADSISS